MAFESILFVPVDPLISHAHVYEHCPWLGALSYAFALGTH